MIEIERMGNTAKQTGKKGIKNEQKDMQNVVRRVPLSCVHDLHISLACVNMVKCMHLM